MVCFSPLLVGSVVATQLVLVPGSSAWRFSPLLVGSVVATTCHCNSRSPSEGFSPLLVGSVVATWGGRGVAGCPQVSVPYWSGQWLQLVTFEHRGAPRRFQSPIGRVSGCNQMVKEGHTIEKVVSVPYWSGQWLQQERGSSALSG